MPSYKLQGTDRADGDQTGMNHTLSLASEQPTNSGWLWRILLIAVGGFALGLRLYYVTHVVMFQPANQRGASGNAVQYYNYARNLVQHGIYSADPIGTMHPVGDSFRDPGYPVFLAAWMEIFPHWDSWYAAVLFSQAFLGAATVVLWLCAIHRRMPLGWLAAAGILMAIWPHSIAMISHLLSETLYGFLVALAMFAFSICMEKPTARHGVVSGLCFSMAALTNGVLLPFAALLITYMLIRRRIPARVALALIMTTACLTIPWMVRNHMQQANQPSSTDRALMNLVEGSWPPYHSADMASIISHEPRATLIMEQINQEIVVIEANHLAGISMVLQRVTQRPGYYIRWYLQKPILLWGWSIRIGVGDIYVYVTYHSPFDTNPIWRAIEALCHSLNPFLMLLALIACSLALLQKRQLQKKQNQELESIALLLIFVTVVHTALQAEPRYSIPYRGAEIVLGMFAVYWLRTYIPKLRAHSHNHEQNTVTRAPSTNE